MSQPQLVEHLAERGALRRQPPREGALADPERLGHLPGGRRDLGQRLHRQPLDPRPQPVGPRPAAAARTSSAWRASSASRYGSAPRTGSASCSLLSSSSVASHPNRTGQPKYRSTSRRDDPRAWAKRTSSGRKLAPSQRRQAATMKRDLELVGVPAAPQQRTVRVDPKMRRAAGLDQRIAARWCRSARHTARRCASRPAASPPRSRYRRRARRRAGRSSAPASVRRGRRRPAGRTARGTRHSVAPAPAACRR